MRMTRPLRLEFSGALYHVTARGDRKSAIYLDDSDRLAWLAMMAQVAARFNFVVYAFCQMTNHFHVVLETVEGNLSQGMRQLNALYSQYFNRRHGLVGHVFQGRYKAILVQKEAYLLELARYVVLNPIRAGMVTQLDDWPWSSHSYVVGTASVPAPEWLDTSCLLGHFASDSSDAIASYIRFVSAGIGMQNPLNSTRNQLILGSDEFAARHRQLPACDLVRAVSKIQRRTFALTLPEYEKKYADPSEAMAQAYLSTAYTMLQIGEHFGVSYKAVSRAVKQFENK